jgi:hypothetical protein
MSELLLDVQSAPATPSAGQSIIWVDSTSKKWQSKDDSGSVDTLGDIENASTANQTGFAADTYLVGSSIAIPSTLLKAKTLYRLVFDMVKTAAGTAAFAINVRVGTAGTTADAARLTFTFGAGTAAIDTGTFEILAHIRNIGASAVLVGICRCTHHLAATGLISTGASGTGILTVTSAAFDSTVANLIIGASVNGGASFSGTNTLVQSELKGI